MNDDVQAAVARLRALAADPGRWTFSPHLKGDLTAILDALDAAAAKLVQAVERLRGHDHAGWCMAGSTMATPETPCSCGVDAPTDPDIAAAVQAMQAGRRVLDREWLKEMLRGYAAKVYQQYSTDAIADAIIAKLTENPRS